MPDIDIDFADRGRDKIIQYVIEKYGQDNVCQIITFGTMAARGVIRDVGRVLAMPYSAKWIRIAKMIPVAAEYDPGKSAGIDLRNLRELVDKDVRVKKLLDLFADAGRTGAPLLDPRRRSGDRPDGADQLRAAFQGDQRRNNDPVRYEDGRGDRPPEDGFSRSSDADGHR